MSFSVGLSAIRSAQMAIDLVGQNLANASVPGYSRNRALLGTGASYFDGARFSAGGVRSLGVERLGDEILTRRLANQQQKVGRRETSLAMLLEIESAFGEPGSNGLSSHFSSFFDALSGLGSAPDDTTRRGQVLAQGDTLARRMRELSGALGDVSFGARFEVEAGVADVNRILDELVVVNEQVTLAYGAGGLPGSLADQQDRLVRELSAFGDIEVRRDEIGRALVSMAGQEVVSATRARHLESRPEPDGTPVLFVTGGSRPVELREGRLKALIDGADPAAVAGKQQSLDAVARNLIANFNRVHARGVPPGGGFETLRSTQRMTRAGGGPIGGAKLSELGLAFPIKNGELHVTVQKADGTVAQEAIAIDPTKMTLQGLVDALSAVDGIDAGIDHAQRLVLNAEPGARFHFGGTVDPDPDDAANFGPAHAQIVGDAGPFALSSGDTLTVSVDGGPPQNVAFSGLANPGAATADEVAAAINAQATGVEARVEDGRLIVRSLTTGTGSGLAFSDASGGPTGTLGLSTTPAQGQASQVAVTASGAYGGTVNDTWTFHPLGSGAIGVTPGLQVEVRDASGAVVAILDVGEGYAPGDEIEVADGVAITLGAGSIDGATGASFTLDLRAESDTADVLLGLGLNAMFTGSDAKDIAVRADLLDDPSLFSQGLGGAASDARNVTALLGLRELGLDGLGGSALEESYASLVSEIGRDVSRARSSLETESQVMAVYENRLEQLRGVSIDEELVDLQRHEQTYQAAARYLAAINEISEILVNL